MVKFYRITNPPVRNTLGRTVLILAIAAIPSSLASVHGGVLVLDGTILRPTVGIAVVAGGILGVVGGPGAGLGYLLAHLATGTLSLVDVGVAHALAWIGVLTYAFLPRRWPTQGERAIQNFLRYLPRYGGAVAVAAGGGTAATAWAYETFGVAPFAVVPHLLFGYLVSAFMIGMPLILVADIATARSERARSSDTSIPCRRPGYATVLILAWLTVGTMGSVGYRAMDRVLIEHPSAFADRGLEFFHLLNNDPLFGTGGASVQVVFGAIMLALLVVSVSFDRKINGRTPQDTTDVDET